MVSLIEITEDNYQVVCGLEITEEQRAYVASPTGILARAYAKRNRNTQALAIVNDETIIGVIMFMELSEEPACYTIEQFLIDHRYQNMGFGRQALKLAIEILAKERKYEAIEICVKMKDTQALRVYEKTGFIDTGYIDPDIPDSYILSYSFQ